MRDTEIEERIGGILGKRGRKKKKKEQANNAGKQLNNAKSQIKPMSIDISLN